MESFEDSIKNSFKDKSVKAPAHVWEKVESNLNADLVTIFQSKQLLHKWISAAAILIAFISLAFQYQPLYNNSSETVYEGDSFNALLGSKYHHYSDFQTDFNRNRTKELLHPLVIARAEESRKDAGPLTVSEEPALYDIHIQDDLASKWEIKTAKVEQEIYPYHQGATYTTYKRKHNESSKVWAGIEAGAGSFNTAISGSNVFSGSINQASLASALGSDGFINPTANVNPDMDPGLATSIGFDFGMRLGNKWTLETGLAYTNVDSRGDASINVLDIYTIDNSEFSDPINPDSELLITGATSRESALEVQDTYDYDIDVRTNFRFTSLPMKAGYFVMDRKMSLRVNVGFAANYFVGSQLRGSDNVINGSANDLFNTWSFDGLGGVELGYSLLDRLDVTLEPNYRQAITPLNGSNDASSRFLVQTGIRYKIQ